MFEVITLQNTKKIIDYRKQIQRQKNRKLKNKLIHTNQKKIKIELKSVSIKFQQAESLHKLWLK